MRRLTLFPVIIIVIVAIPGLAGNASQSGGGRGTIRSTAAPGPASALLALLREQTNPDQRTT
jgi:hypothetical protein